MAFPDDLKAATAAPDEAADKLWQERLEISMLSYEQSQISPNLHHWRVTSISPVKLSLRLTFENPLEVSQGDEPDNLLVRFKRGKFTDLDGLSLPPDLTKMANLPSQALASHVPALEAISEEGSKAMKSVLGANSAVSFAATAPLRQVWGLLNAQ